MLDSPLEPAMTESPIPMLQPPLKPNKTQQPMPMLQLKLLLFEKDCKLDERVFVPMPILYNPEELVIVPQPITVLYSTVHNLLLGYKQVSVKA